MEPSSLIFIAFALIVALLANAFPTARGRSVVMALASACFIASYSGSALQVLPLIAFLTLGFCVLRIVQVSSSRTTLWTGIAAIVLAFVYLKRFSFMENVPALPFTYVSLGLSYILFRLIHLIVDASQGELPERIGPLGFFNYNCNFLSFISGPIQRYQDHRAIEARTLVLDQETVHQAFVRIVSGYIKVAIISAIADHVFTLLSARLVPHTAGMRLSQLVPLYIATTSAYAAYLYYNFAGYMDIVIGFGKLTGYELPENFNRPFSSRNFLEFWSRWHITLSDWFKVYVFNPLLKLMAQRIQAPVLQPFLGVIAFFLCFLLIGMWHGTTAAFLVYGLTLGAAASANKLWQVLLTRRLGKQRYKTLCANPLYSTLCMGMSFTTFAMALSCFWSDITQLRALATALGAGGFALAFMLLSVLSGAVLRAGEQVSAWISAKRASLQTAMASSMRASFLPFAHNLLLGSRVLMITCVASFFHKAPEFVYRAF